MNLTIACVWVGERYGAAYPAVLMDMVRRNLPPAHTPRFVCVTDRPAELPAGMEALEPEPGLPGWWQKLALFKPGKIPCGRIPRGENCPYPFRIAYFDLDVAITGELGELVERKGIIRDWHLPGYNSSVMIWDAGDHDEIWTEFRPAYMDTMHGDQDWITEAAAWATLPPEWCLSYRSHSQVWPPDRAKVIVFHGQPKPHEIADGWVPKVWREGGLVALPKLQGLNVPTGQVLENIRRNCERDLTWFSGGPAHDRECCIVGGGPSAAECLEDIRARVAAGAALVSLNGSLRWLLERDLMPSSHVVLDARPENAKFALDVPATTTVLAASQCHESVFRVLADHPNVVLWHAGLHHDEVEGIVRQYVGEDPALIVGGGSTVGLRAMFLANLAGFRKLHLYGFDSCYHDDAHHAYAQPLNDGERTITVQMAGQTYRCAVWQARQANEFNGQYAVLAREGCEIEAHGRGLIPDICRILNAQRGPSGRLRQIGDVWWPEDDRVGCAIIPAEVDKIAEVLPLCRGRAVAVQGGANVGLVPKALAGHFGRVVAFEPEPVNAKAARLNINGARVELHQAALGERPGHVAMCGQRHNCGAFQTNAGGSIPVKTIDGLGLEACDLIMLDVEGDELPALKGAALTIAEHRPVVVIEEKGICVRHGLPEGAPAAWLAAEFGYREAMRLGNDVVLVPGGQTPC